MFCYPKPTVLLMLGTILLRICSTLSQVTETCSAQPSEPVISYDFDFNSMRYGVCPTSDAAIGVWVFRPAESTPSAAARGTYTVSGTALRTCVYNVSSSQRLQLVVTPPNSTDQDRGDFDVTFVSQTGMTVTLSVSYLPRGFYREVNESIVQGSSFTEPLWLAIGFALGGVTVCIQNRSGTLESFPFLTPDFPRVNNSTCLPGGGTSENPLYISLGINGDVPNNLIGETLPIVIVTGNCQVPGIRSDPVMVTVLNATIPTTVPPSPSPLPSPGVSTVSPTTTTPPGGSNAGLIAGVVVGVLLLIVVVLSVAFGVVFGFHHLNKIRKNSLSRRASRASISRQSSTEKGERPQEVNLELENDPRYRALPVSPPVSHAVPLRASPPAHPHVEHTDSGSNFIVVVTPFKNVAECLASKHGVSLQPFTTSEQTRILNGYSHHVSSALADNKCQFVYLIWNCSLEETSWEPLSGLVRELISRPLPSAGLKKVIFVQLGSRSTHPLSVNILQFALEISPDSDNFNAQECAQLIHDRVQREVESDAVDGVVQRTTRTVDNEVTPTDTSSPKYHTLQSPPPPPYSAVNPDPRSRSLPQTRATERLRTATSPSADSSPLVGLLLETNKKILDEVRGLHSTQKQAVEQEAARSEKQINLMEQEAVRSEKRTELDEKRTGLMEQEVTKSEERNEKLVSAVSEVGADAKQAADGVQNLEDRFDELTVAEDEPKTNAFST